MSLGMWCHTIRWAGWEVKYETLLPPGQSPTNEEQHKSRSYKTVNTRNKSSKPEDFLHITLAELHPPPNGLWLDISSTGATTLSLQPSLSRPSEFLSSLGEKIFVFMGTGCMFQIRGWAGTVHQGGSRDDKKSSSAQTEVVVVSSIISPGPATNTSFNYAGKIWRLKIKLPALGTI